MFSEGDEVEVLAGPLEKCDDGHKNPRMELAWKMEILHGGCGGALAGFAAWRLGVNGGRSLGLRWDFVQLVK